LPLSLPALRYDLNIPNVANRLEKAVDKALDEGYRTKDIYKEAPGTKLVKCSEMGEILLTSVTA
jgi:3-isopropylmalate dehydrogenase